MVNTLKYHRIQNSSSGQSPEPDKPTVNPRSVLIEIAGLFLFLSIVTLLDGVMLGNEVDVLPLARQYAQPSWMPNDWYLNQPEGYRLLFQLIVGHMIAAWGFLATSIVGRLICYLFVSVGIVCIAKKLTLRFPFLIFAVTLNLCLHWIRGAMANAESYVPGVFDDLLGRRGADVLFLGVIVVALGLLALSLQNHRIDRALVLLLLAGGCLLASNNRPYSIVSNEWYIGGLEAKAMAYGLVFCAIALMLNAKYLWTALLLGIATSFHVLAGGYAMLVTGLYLLLRKKAYFNSWQSVVGPVLLYISGAVCALPAVVSQLLSEGESGPLTASFIYVFIRLPHHLNPAAWPDRWWLSLIFYLSVLGISEFVIRRESAVGDEVRAIAPSTELFEFTLVAMLPFAAGLIASTVDTTGALLQYYPFRFSDVMLPFSSCLLFSLALQHSADRRKFVQRPLSALMVSIVAICLVFETQSLPDKISGLRSFPELSTDKQELYGWVENNTDSTDRFVTPPAELEEFSWKAERPTIAKLKMLPQTSEGVVDWYERLGELSGNPQDWSAAALSGNAAVFNQVSEILTDGYESLNKEQINELMETYQADYFVTPAVDNEPVMSAVFENESYRVYSPER